MLAFSPQPIDKELLRDIVLAVGVLKSQVKLVLIVEHVETSAGTTRTGLVAACTININRDVLAQLFCIIQASISFGG